MSKREKSGLVPALRFPEFLAAANWAECLLGQCLLQHPEYGINAPAVPYSANLPGYLRITDISDDGQIRKDQKVSVAKSVTDENHLDDGDIVLARTGPSVGKSYKYRTEDGRLVFAGLLIRVRPNEEKLNSELLFQFLSTEQYWRWVEFSSVRCGQRGLNDNEYTSLPIPLPPTLNEQQKIADCLTSIDELVIAQKQKLEALNAYKKGLMQQLFPAEGETVPRVRFPEFQGKGEWYKGCIDDFATLIMGNAFKSSDFVEDGVQLLRIANLYQGILQLDRSAVYLPGSFAKEYLKFVIKPLDLLMPMTGTVGKQDYGSVVQVPSDSSNIMLNQRVVKVIPKNECVKEFLLQLLKSNDFLKNLYQLPVGSIRANLSVQQLKGLDIRFPKMDEQQKIADCLSSIDELITVQSQEIKSLKAHKKGLMQQLFPTVDEMNL